VEVGFVGGKLTGGDLGQRIVFVIVARLTQPLKRMIPGLPYTEVRPGLAVAEGQYQPHGWPHPYRFVVVRKTLPEEESPQTTLFTVGRSARQKLALVTLARLARERPSADGEAVRVAMAVVVNRCADKWASLVVWNVVGEKTEHVFGRQALPIVWDYCEANPFTDMTGGYDGAVDWVAKVVEASPGSRGGQVQQADATEHPLPDETAQVWFTDPPYYFAVPYADLSDFFFVWLKRVLPGHRLLRDPFDPSNPLTPKRREAVQDETKRDNGRAKDRAWFEETMAKAFAEGRRVLREDGVGAVVFAHKTTEGWEALLSGMIRGGWTITGSWPIATEMASRLCARESAALATSVHLICRPRPEDAPVGDWGEVLRELPKRVGHWMERLQAEGVRGADLVFACIGPALEIFSRYSRVETAEGREVALAEFLEKVWEVVGRAALQQVLGSTGGAGALEEDARLTALFLWTLQSTNANGGQAEATEGEEEAEAAEDEEEEEDERPRKAGAGYALVFDVVRRFAQPLGIRLPEWESRVIETKKGVVRLLTIRERAKVLFGGEGADLVAHRIESTPRGPVQLELLLGDRVAKRVPTTPRAVGAGEGALAPTLSQRVRGSTGLPGGQRPSTACTRLCSWRRPARRPAGAAPVRDGARARVPPLGQCSGGPLP